MSLALRQEGLTVDLAATGEPVRVGLVEDHPLYRGALIRTLTAPGIEVVTAVDTVAELVAGPRPDVAVLGLRLDPAGPMAGATAVHELTRHGLRVLVLSADEARPAAVAAISAGAAGYLGKSAGEDAIRAAVRAVAAGGAAPQVPAAEDGPQLSAREREVLVLLATGAADTEIARSLGIKATTVRTHLDRISLKRGRRRRADLTRLAYEEGLLG
jgi:DNA-binding NarL/FixJ family response regulator